MTIVASIAVVILSLVLFVVVHAGLGRLYLAYIRRFCRKRGLSISRIRHGRMGEGVLVDLDCLDADQRRRLIRLLVWIFGIRQVLRNEDWAEDWPEEPAAPTPDDPGRLMTHDQYFSRQKALRREELWVHTILGAAFLAFLGVNLLIAKYMDEANIIVQVVYGCCIAAVLIGFFLCLFGCFPYQSRLRKRRIRRHGLECPACGRALIGEIDRERFVAGMGQCWACGAMVLTPPAPSISNAIAKKPISLPVRYSYDPPWWVTIGTAFVALLIFTIAGISAITLTVASILIFFALSSAFRRFVCKRYLELTEDALLLPTGFFRMHMVRVPYDAIESVWEYKLSFLSFLYLRANRKRYEIAGFMADREGFVTVRDFLIETAARNGKEALPS